MAKWPLRFDLVKAIKTITIGKKSNTTEDDVKRFLNEKCYLSKDEISQININKKRD